MPNADRNNDQAFKGVNVLVAVTGGISCYKTASLVSRLAQSGAAVRVVMTESATRFAHGDTAVPPGPGARVAVRRRAAQGPLAESCGGDPLPVWVWEPAPQ